MAHIPVLDSFRLDGKVALVTGGARGLGLTMATALAEAGADVARDGARERSRRGGAAKIAAATGRRAKTFAADVTSASDIDRLVTSVEAELGPIDILVNNAGVNIRGTVDQLSEADWDSVIDTNLKGPFLVSRAVGPRMVKRGWGRVVNLGSILGAVALGGRAPYASSKAGVINLTRVLALEWAGTGVTANAICPGPFATEMNLPAPERSRQVSGFREEDSDGPLGRARRDHRRGGVPGVAGIIVHHRHVAVRRWGLDSAIGNAEC